MNDRYLILKFLIRNVKDDHLAVYLYSYGHNKSKITAINHLHKLLNQVFSNVFSYQLMNSVIKEYLDFKLYQYKTGEIIVKPRY